MKREWVCWSWKGTALLWMALGVWTNGVAQRLIWLGTLPGGDWSEARDVSQDGRVVVGISNSNLFSGYGFRAFRWTAWGGMQFIGMPTASGQAHGVSANGWFVVGEGAGTAGAFRWSAWSGAHFLGRLPGDSWSGAYDVSADGSVVVGSSYNASGYGRAFRWTAQGGMQDLGTLGGRHSEAYGVSADGSVVVGRATNASGQSRAFRWTAQGGMQDLGTLGGGSYAQGVSADGSVVVGWAYDVSGYARAFRWTAAGGMQDLGTLGGDYSQAFGVSADGSVVVGFLHHLFSGYSAFRWTERRGMENLNVTYGCLLTDGSWLSAAYAISPCGRYIVGKGLNVMTGRMEGYLLDTLDTGRRVDVDCNGCVDDTDLLMVLFMFGQSGSDIGRTDLNNDGTVDDADLLEVLFNFGQGC